MPRGNLGLFLFLFLGRDHKGRVFRCNLFYTAAPHSHKKGFPLQPLTRPQQQTINKKQRTT
jgi:hypothetical protein